MANSNSENVAFVPVERKNGLWALRICPEQGLLTGGMVRRILEVMDAHGLDALRATTGQRMTLENVPADKLDAVCAALGTKLDKAPPGVTVCIGRDACKYGTQSTRALGTRLQAEVKANGPYPFKIKTGVSGCKMGCGNSFVRDLGLVGTPKGWDVRFGACGTRKANPGMLLASGLDDGQALDLVRKALAFYKENGRKRERMSGTLARLGEDAVREGILGSVA